MAKPGDKERDLAVNVVQLWVPRKAKDTEIKSRLYYSATKGLFL